MTHWEYMTLGVLSDPRSGQFVDKLNELGRQGWELVAVGRQGWVLPATAQPNDGNSVLLFKRPVPEPVAQEPAGLDASYHYGAEDYLADVGAGVLLGADYDEYGQHVLDEDSLTRIGNDYRYTDKWTMEPGTSDDH